MAAELPQPVLRWKMNEGAGTSLADSSGNGWTGTLSGASAFTWGTASVGISGGTYNSVATLATVPANNPALTTAAGVTQIGGVANLTMSLWIYLPSSTANWEVGGFNTQGYRVGFTSFAGTVYVVAENGGVNSFATVVYPSATTWHHVMLVYDGTQGVAANRVKVYVDGSAVAVTPNTGTFPTTLATTAHMGSMSIGHDLTDSTFSNFTFTDFQIFTVSATAAQAAAMANAGPL